MIRPCLSVLLVATALGAQAPATPTTPAGPPAIAREFRGVWVASVSNIDWPSRPGLTSFEQQSELLAILNRAAALHLNAVILQVRPAADALYESPYEPWSYYLTGRQGRAPEPYYDPLRFAIDAAHERGLELHAWFNPYRARHPSAQGPNARTHLSNTRPPLVKRYGTHEWMDPGEPAVMEQTLRVMLDVVRRYDVDGIHIDDYFYPYPETGADSQPIPFPDSASHARYQARGGRLGRDDWRRHNVDTLVQEIYRRTKAVKPWVKVGISPFGIWRPGFPATIQGFDAFDKLYADSRKWINAGWVDYFTPQLYWPITQTPQSYTTLLDWWMRENTHSRAMWPGQFTSRAIQTTGIVWPAGEIAAQVRATRAAGAGGTVHFSMRTLMPELPGRRDSVGGAVAPRGPAAPTTMAADLVREVYADRALVPAMPWLSRSAPDRPIASLGTDRASGDHVLSLTPARGRTIRWWTVRAEIGGAWQSWVLPGSQRRFTVAAGGAAAPARVVVTAVDRYGTESAAVTVRSR